MALLIKLRKKVYIAILTVILLAVLYYADDITLLAPSRDALNNMLDVCSEYAEAYDILINATETKCMFFL